LLALLVLIGLPSAVISSVFGLSQLRFTEVSLEGGGGKVPQEWVKQQVAPWKGSHLLLVSASEIESRLSQHPWVAAAEARKRLPNRLHLRIIERRAAALLLGEGRPGVFLDAAGRRIAPQGSEDTLEGLPVVEAGLPVPPATLVRTVALFGTTGQVSPDATGRLEAIRILAGGENFELQFADLPFTVLLGAEDPAGQLRRLPLVLPEIRRRFRNTRQVDLRFGREVVLRLPERTAKRQ
jgi:cell division protein FtsQ